MSDPTHPAVVGVTVIVAVTGELVAFKAVNVGTGPVPLAANPMEGVLFVQAKVVEPKELVNAWLATETLLQTVKFETALRIGSGCTVIDVVNGVPEHPALDTGTTV